MKILNKQQVEANIGKNSMWANKSYVLGCSYLAGFDELDRIIGENNFKNLPAVGFVMHPKGIMIQIQHRFKNYFAGLTSDSIKSIVFEPGKVFAEKDKSVVGRAILGGVLLGPLGAVIGGVSGIGSSSIRDLDNLLITVEIDGIDQALLFQVEKGKSEAIVKFFRQNFNAKFQIA